jgi:hypothetical protein
MRRLGVEPESTCAGTAKDTQWNQATLWLLRAPSPVALGCGHGIVSTTMPELQFYD